MEKELRFLKASIRNLLNTLLQRHLRLHQLAGIYTKPIQRVWLRERVWNTQSRKERKKNTLTVEDKTGHRRQKKIKPAWFGQFWTNTVIVIWTALWETFKILFFSCLGIKGKRKRHKIKLKRSHDKNYNRVRQTFHLQIKSSFTHSSKAWRNLLCRDIPFNNNNNSYSSYY